MRHGSNALARASTHTHRSSTFFSHISPAFAWIFVLRRMWDRNEWIAYINGIANQLIYIDGGFLFDMRSLYFTIKLSTHQRHNNRPTLQYLYSHTAERREIERCRELDKPKHTQALHKFPYNYFVLKMTSGQFILLACNFKMNMRFGFSSSSRQKCLSSAWFCTSFSLRLLNLALSLWLNICRRCSGIICDASIYTFFNYSHVLCVCYESTVFAHNFITMIQHLFDGWFRLVRIDSDEHCTPHFAYHPNDI